MVSIQTLILCSNPLILWNGCCGWRKEDSLPAVTAVLDASREPIIIVWHWGVQPGATPHLLQSADTYRRTMALPTGDLSMQMLYQIKQTSMYAFTSLQAVVWKSAIEVFKRVKSFLCGWSGQQALWDQFRRSLSECCHRDHTGRMESGSVRVSIFSTTIEGLLRLLPPCWLAALQ